MAKRTMVSLSILVFIMLNIFTGCSNKEFDKKYDDFKTSYLKVTEVLDVKEPLTSTEKLKTESLLNELSYMKDIRDQMEQEASSEREKGLFGNVDSFYSGLEYLYYAVDNREKLTEEERGRFDIELLSAVVTRDSIKRGEL